MTTHTLTKDDLSQFYGTEVWYRHSLVKNVLYTEGVRYVAEHGGAYWLIDLIAFHQAATAVRAEPFQLWILTVQPNGTAGLTCQDGNGVAVYGIEIDYTDFPLNEIKFYFTDSVLMLPSEY